MPANFTAERTVHFMQPPADVAPANDRSALAARAATRSDGVLDVDLFIQLSAQPEQAASALLAARDAQARQDAALDRWVETGQLNHDHSAPQPHNGPRDVTAQTVALLARGRAPRATLEAALDRWVDTGALDL